MCYIQTLLLTLCIQISFCYVLNRCFAAPHSSLYYTYTVSTNSSINSYVNLNFTLAPSFSPALAVIQTTNHTPSLTRQDWLHINPKNNTNFDYQGLVTGRTQNAWLPNPGAGTLLHIYLLNFDVSALPCFNLLVDETPTPRLQCSSPYYYGSTNYCSQCPISVCGVYCSIKQQKMSQGSINTFSLSPLSYSAVRLSASNSLGISISSLAGGVSVYFQWDVDFEQLAGMVNYLEDEGSYHFSTGLTYTRYFTVSNQSFAVGIFNQNSYPVTLSISYPGQNNTDVMLILIGVLGGLLGIGVIIALVMIIKRIRQTTMVHSHTQIMPRINLFHHANPSKLSRQQIELYFPNVPRSAFFPSHPRKQENKEECSEYECVICLCSIEAAQQIKVAYCKHFFHAKCLTEWFDKQQNCPYCRKDFSRSATLALYRELARERGKELKGQELVRCLFRPTMNTTMETLAVEDIEDVTFEQ